MARRITGLALGLGLLLPLHLHAQSVPGTVVELFTSQGCSSCPPADAFLERLADQPGVIALALHVDYWDYIGWKDNFADPKFTDRQRAYASAAGQSTIYTPQMVVGGLDHAVGSDPQMVSDLIRQHQQAAQPITLDLDREADQVVVRASTSQALNGPLVVQLVRFQPSARVSIEHGENAGKTIDYANIVTSWTQIGVWSGQGELRLTADAEGPEAVVVILQDEGPGLIRAAAMLR